MVILDRILGPLKRMLRVNRNENLYMHAQVDNNADITSMYENSNFLKKL